MLDQGLRVSATRSSGLKTIPVRMLLVALVGLLAMVGIACAASSQAAAPVQTDRVEMAKSYRFDPVVIEVAPGTTVTWHNDDNFTHSVKLESGSGEYHDLKPGESATITFDQPGEYNYICTYHAQDMKGKVIVKE